jgi:hypothetical protein
MQLVNVVRTSLRSLEKAIQGLLVMSAELESVFKAIAIGAVPKLWQGVSFPCLKGIGGYVQATDNNNNNNNIRAYAGATNSFKYTRVLLVLIDRGIYLSLSFQASHSKPRYLKMDVKASMGPVVMNSLIRRTTRIVLHIL